MNAPLLQVGGNMSKDTSKNMGDLITTIFKTGRQTGMDQETIRLALTSAFSSLEVTNTTVSGCVLTGEKSC